MYGFRIRVGKEFFSLPRYIVSMPTPDSKPDEDVQPKHKAQPMIWANRPRANTALRKVIKVFPSAYIERFDIDLEEV